MDRQPRWEICIGGIITLKLKSKVVSLALLASLSLSSVVQANSNRYQSSVPEVSFTASDSSEGTVTSDTYYGQNESIENIIVYIYTEESSITMNVGETKNLYVQAKYLTGIRSDITSSCRYQVHKVRVFKYLVMDSSPLRELLVNQK